MICILLTYPWNPLRIKAFHHWFLAHCVVQFPSIITLIVSEDPVMRCWFSWRWTHDSIWSLSRLFGSWEAIRMSHLCFSLRVGCREALLHIEIFFWTWSVSPPADKLLLFMHMNACDAWSLYQSRFNADFCSCKCSVVTSLLSETSAERFSSTHRDSWKHCIWFKILKNGITGADKSHQCMSHIYHKPQDWTKLFKAKLKLPACKKCTTQINFTVPPSFSADLNVCT